DLALAAADYWGAVTTQAFASAPYRALADPVERVLGYLDFRKAILKGTLPEYTCLAGMMVQETYETHPAIREACRKTIHDHAAMVEADIAEAIVRRGMQGNWSAKGLALHTQAVLQGAFVLAKAEQDPGVAAACIDHLRRYLEMMFTNSPAKEVKQ
ncbi:MAG: TetR family transcriptional regulator C-terminal domain-containing protein, partial [Aestuariivirgaceae bacterium]